MARFALQGSAIQPVPGAAAAGPASPGERLEVSVILRSRAPGQLAARVAQATAATPVAPMTREQFAQDFGADPKDVATVVTFAHAHGLAVVQQEPARRTVVLSGTVAQCDTAFGVALQNFVHDGGTYRGRTGDITLPTELQGLVVAVLGLDNRPVAAPRFRIHAPPANVRWQPHASAHRRKHKQPTAPNPAPAPAPGPAPNAAPVSYTPLEVAALYGFPAGTGAGQCVGIIELGGGFRPADLTAYFAGLGVASPTVVAVSVDQAANTPTGDPSGPDGEVMLDIEIVGAIAPQARIAVYFAPNTEAGFLDAITTAIHDTTNKPSVLSISWGGPESSYTQQSTAAFDSAFQVAATLGVTVCAASGDGGSSDGLTDGADHVDFPASSPNCLACGGTSLQASGGAIASETVWNDGPGRGAGGGGVSAIFTAPPYQGGLRATHISGQAQALTMRGVPDIAGNADPATGYAVRIDGTDTVVGGTSAVAPLWAGLIARINQAAGSPVGFANPRLYGRPAALNDITAGDNGDFEATAGWDACTGLGSPNGPAVAGALGAPVGMVGATGIEPVTPAV